jgi:transcriptional regulator with XRE-family HTH domain
MTTRTDGKAAGRRGPARRHRPAPRKPPEIGITIDPAQLQWWRKRRALSRQGVSDRIAGLFLDGHEDALPFMHRAGHEPADGHAVRPQRKLTANNRRVAGEVRRCTVCGEPVTGGITRDGLAKIENGERHPKPETVLALLAVLSTGRRRLEPEDLMPGAPERAPSQAEREREERLARNKAIRRFAAETGNSHLLYNKSGRIYYGKRIRDLYAEYLAREHDLLAS